MSKYIVTIALVLAAAVQGKDCEKACKYFEDNNQKFLVHEGKVACKKHNISPRPTTEDICLSTFRALTRSTCMNYCDSASPLVPEACGAIAGTTWIPKHNAYKACKTGYREATRKIPGLIEAAMEGNRKLEEMFSVGFMDHSGFKVHKSSTISFDKSSREELAKEEHDAVDPSLVAQGEEEVYEFPITIDDGSVQTLVVSSKDKIADKVNEFCGKYMQGEDDCSEQLLPIVIDRMQA